MSDNEDVWTYGMRREMQEILPGLYLGPYSVANKSKLKILLEYGITHVICIRHNVEAHIIKPNFPANFKYLTLNISDTYFQNLISFITESKQFIDECLSSGGKCLVHGNLGISRSAAIVIAYVMENKSMSYLEALEFVQKKRYCISPNEHFMQQLMEYEVIYKAQRTLLSGQPSHNNASLKRKSEIDEDRELLTMDVT